jgi:hypothetical protein
MEYVRHIVDFGVASNRVIAVSTGITFTMKPWRMLAVFVGHHRSRHAALAFLINAWTLSATCGHSP